MTRDAAAVMTATATTRMPRNIGVLLEFTPGAYLAPPGRTPVPVSVCVLFYRHTVVHLVDAEDLRLATVRAQLVVLAHDQRLDRLGRADLGAKAAKAAA